MFWCVRFDPRVPSINVNPSGLRKIVLWPVSSESFPLRILFPHKHVTVQYAALEVTGTLLERA